MPWILADAKNDNHTESTVGYNNKLKQASTGMKLSVNNGINLGTTKEGLQLMEGGPSKINPPNSHPSNPIHKAIMAAQNPKPALKTADGVLETQTPTDEGLETQTDRETPQHEINKTALIVSVVRVVALILISMR